MIDFNNSDEELNSLRKLSLLQKDSPQIRKSIANILLNKGNFEEAEKEYKIALALAPDDFEIKLKLAETFYHENKNSEALVIIEDLLKNKSVNENVHILYSKLLMRMGDIEEALKEYKKTFSTYDDEYESILLSEPVDFYEKNDKNSKNKKQDFGNDIKFEKAIINFDDVGGMENLKEEIKMKIIYPVQHEELYKAYGKSIGGGILIYGPSGCGKTHIAKATAGEVKANFISVDINDVLDMWVGQSEKNLHEIFEQARKSQPCVIFFDEIDSLGTTNSMKYSKEKPIINQFLSELDDLKDSNDAILVIATTNAPWHLDPAFRRLGRFDRIIFVPPPDIEARVSIFTVLLKDKPISKIDYQAIANKTKHFSGADIKAVVDLAIEEKLKDAIKKGSPELITTKSLLNAIKKVTPSTKEWFFTAKNYALYSNQGGFYDNILDYLNNFK